MRSKRPIIRQCKNLAKQHVDNPDEPAAPDGASGFAEWTQIAFILLHAELDKDFRETEAWFNDSRAIREELNIDKSPDHTTLCRWEQQVDMRELRSLLRQVRSRLAGREQQQSTPVASSEIKPAIITGIVLASRFTS